MEQTTHKMTITQTTDYNVEVEMSEGIGDTSIEDIMFRLAHGDLMYDSDTGLIVDANGAIVATTKLADVSEDVTASIWDD